MSIELNQRASLLLKGLSRLQLKVVETTDVTRQLAPYRHVPPFLRSLLVADGTVTMALEAYYLEDIVIRTQRQGAFLADESLPSLDLNKGERAFYREVELRGAESDQLYASAASILNSRSIDTQLFDQLVDERVGIGVILRNFARGSHREVMSINEGGLMTEADISRTYRVSLNEKPAILITEEFNYSAFQPDL